MKGKLFIIEGVDSSGKETQTKKLVERLIKDGFNVKTVSFPDYDSESSALVKMYLRGDFGTNANDVDLYTASTFYAVDRYASYKTKWGKFFEDGGIVICDRYTTSNMVHQASKLSLESEKDKFLEWLMDLEYGMYKLPMPDDVIFLDMPPEQAIQLMELRKNKFSGEESKDIHERDESHLVGAYKNAHYVASKMNWSQIKCVDNGKIKTIEDISNEVYERIRSQIN